MTAVEDRMSRSKIWFVTGASRGFGRIWAEAALARGDRVVVTARNQQAFEPLVEQYGELVLPLRLDVADKAAVDAAFATANDHFGRIDVVVNNAGVGMLGAIEEFTEEQIRTLMETNLFGAIWVTKAAVPYLRLQGHGHILQISSCGGVQAYPGNGIYGAAKWAMEAYSQALAGEVASFGVKVTLVEPGSYITTIAANRIQITPMPEYDAVKESHAENPVRTRKGDPEATAAAILELVDTDDPPLRLFLGDWLLDMIRAEYQSRIDTWERWNDLALGAQGGVRSISFGDPSGLPISSHSTTKGR
jgi:NAD(P)-dependent dehydrogenase (short-subunit alcohol dehydrogenase family)